MTLATELNALTGMPFSKGFSDIDASLYFGKIEGLDRHKHASHSVYVVSEKDTYTIEITRENPRYGGSSGGRSLKTVEGITLEQVHALILTHATKYGQPSNEMQSL